jgi:hypothetical protein
VESSSKNVDVNLAVLQKIHARLCQISTVDEIIAQDFLKKFHRQGDVVISTSLTSLGLFYKEELVGVAQFCYPRTKGVKRKYTTELLRLAFKDNVRVAGGASKIIAYYKRYYHPTDIFTYQDVRGEGTSVYEHCGFTLASQARRKQYLVAPGKTLETGSNREVLEIAYAVRYGPDRILGTKLGEIFREDTTRKTNVNIFMEDRGWHIEEILGDRLYEWFNPDITFYTYIITASDSDKYYYGVRCIKLANATLEDCQGDSYWGSGGAGVQNKFQNWKRKHKSNLQKEVLQTFSTKVKAYLDERQLIGNLWETDKNCLNSTQGGYGQAPIQARVTMQKCSIHGEVKHCGNSCYKCAAQKREHVGYCFIHGKVSFRGASCLICQAQRLNSFSTCPVHGLTMFVGTSCRKCSTAKVFTSQVCLIHGKCTFRGSSCINCQNDKKIKIMNCMTHGLTKHLGARCAKCIIAQTDSIKECRIHGFVPHRGDSCFSCTLTSAVTVKECPIHGPVKYKGAKCTHCQNLEAVSEKICPIHGKTKHQGMTCSRCSAKKQIIVSNCLVHGLTKHRGKTCFQCLNAPVLLTCPVHGLTKHRGKTCFQCVADRKSRRTNSSSPA